MGSDRVETAAVIKLAAQRRRRRRRRTKQRIKIRHEGHFEFNTEHPRACLALPESKTPPTLQ